MKTRVLGGVVAAAILITVPTAFAQSPRGSAEATVGSAEVSIEYGRPSLQGRDMLGQATDGMVWRLGADASTTLTTSGDLDFGGRRSRRVPTASSRRRWGTAGRCS